MRCPSRFRPCLHVFKPRRPDLAAEGLEAAVVRVAVQRLLGRLLQRVHRVQQEPDRLL